MLWAKATIAGLAAAAAAVTLAPFIVLPMAKFFFPPREAGDAIGWDPIAGFRQSVVPWLILLAVFVAGIY